MIEAPMTEAIAEKQLRYTSPTGVESIVTVSLGKPILDPREGRRWVCPYRILGLSDESTGAAFGATSLQALTFALHALPAELALLLRSTGGRFVPPGSEDLGLGFACKTHLNLEADA